MAEQAVSRKQSANAIRALSMDAVQAAGIDETAVVLGHQQNRVLESLHPQERGGLHRPDAGVAVDDNLVLVGGNGAPDPREQRHHWDVLGPVERANGDLLVLPNVEQHDGVPGVKAGLDLFHRDFHLLRDSTMRT